MTFPPNPTDDPDGIRGPGFGAGVLVNEFPGSLAASATVTFGPFYVGNAPALNVSLGTEGATPMTNVAYTLSWYPSSSSSGLVLASTAYYAEALTAGITDVVVNKGPWLYVQVQNFSTNPAQYTLFVGQSQGGTGGLAPYTDRVLYSGQAVAVGATSAVTQPFAQMVPGPATIWSNSGANGTVTITELQQGGGFLDIIQLTIGPTGAGNNNPTTFTVPNNECQVVLRNTSAGASTIYTVIVSQR